MTSLHSACVVLAAGRRCLVGTSHKPMLWEPAWRPEGHGSIRSGRLAVMWGFCGGTVAWPMEEGCPLSELTATVSAAACAADNICSISSGEGGTLAEPRSAAREKQNGYEGSMSARFCCYSFFFPNVSRLSMERSVLYSRLRICDGFAA
jgi:hypothetical protein